ESLLSCASGCYIQPWYLRGGRGGPPSPCPAPGVAVGCHVLQESRHRAVIPQLPARKSNPFLQQHVPVGQGEEGRSPACQLSSPEGGSFAISVQQVPPTLIQRTYGLTPHYIYPQAIVQPSVVIPAAPVPPLSSPYIEYTPASPAYAQYPPATYDQYPYAASPATAASFVGYSYPAAVPQALSAAAPTGTTFLQYQPPQLQPDRMQ
uniref:Uncharacterized protein n=1 Tax=Ovis aries TaxID=9940 RepID=A0AC11DQT7_SHEEP